MRQKREKTSRQLFRRNQVIITTLAVMIAAAGYLNYAGKKEIAVGSAGEAGILEISDEDVLAENQAGAAFGETYAVIDSLDDQPEDGEPALAADGEELVLGLDGQEIAFLDENGETIAAETGESDAELTGLENPGEAVLTSGMSVTDYIAGVQLSREQIRAKNRESLLELIENDSIDEAAKQQAVQDLTRLTDTAEKENAAETLLQAKGFANPVVSVSSDQVDVVISESAISDQQRAQIEDIVKRKTEKNADQIVISLMNLEE